MRSSGRTLVPAEGWHQPSQLDVPDCQLVILRALLLELEGSLLVCAACCSDSREVPLSETGLVGFVLFSAIDGCYIS